MAEVSWLSDYVNASERSADRMGAGAGQGFGGSTPAKPDCVRRTVTEWAIATESTSVPGRGF